MHFKHLRILGLLLFGITLCGAQIIQNFEVSTVKDSKSIHIEASKAFHVKDVKEASSNLKEQIFFRKKTAKGKYVLVIAGAKSSFNTLSSFSLSDLKIEEALKLQFFSKKSQSNLDDLSDVYFDNANVYVSGVKELFYNINGKWNSILSNKDTLGKLNITTDGNEIVAEIDGIVMGKGNLTTSGLLPGHHRLKLYAPGYYATVHFVNVQSGKTEELNFKMIPKRILDAKYIDMAHFQFLKTDSMDKLEELMIKLNDELFKLRDLADTKLKLFEQDYPKLTPSPQGVDAWQNDSYMAYKESFERTKIQTFNSSIANLKKNIDKLEKRRVELKKEIVARESQIVHKDMNPGSFKSKRDESAENSYLFKFRLGGSSSTIDAKWKGIVSLDSAQYKKALDLLNKKKPVLRLTYQNKSAKIPVQKKIIRRYYRFVSLDLMLSDSLKIPLDGTFSFPPYIMENAEVAKYFEDLEVVQRKEAFIAEQKNLASDQKNRLNNQEELLKLDKLLRSDVVEVERGRFEFQGRNVSISAFAINKTEITQDHYKRITGKNPSKFKDKKKPVHNVSYLHAKKFCDDIGGALPTEAQWEYAALAGSEEVYFWGDKEKSPLAYAVYRENSYKLPETARNYGPNEVGTKKPNSWGLMDVSGNVSEWVSDNHSSFHFFVSVKDPKGPLTGHFKVFKGGSWKDKKHRLQLDANDYEDPRYYGDEMGFRCAFAAGLKMDKPDMEKRLAKYLKKQKKKEAKEDGGSDSTSVKEGKGIILDSIVAPKDSSQMKAKKEKLEEKYQKTLDKAKIKENIPAQKTGDSTRVAPPVKGVSPGEKSRAKEKRPAAKDSTNVASPASHKAKKNDVPATASPEVKPAAETKPPTDPKPAETETKKTETKAPEAAKEPVKKEEPKKTEVKAEEKTTAPATESKKSN